MEKVYKNFNPKVYDESKGFCVMFVPWESMTGKFVVIDRVKTFDELDQLLTKVHSGPENGGIDLEETQTLSIVNDYDFHLPS